MELLAKLEKEMRDGRTLEEWERYVTAAENLLEWNAAGRTEDDWEEEESERARLVLEAVVIEILRNGFEDYCEEDLVNYAEGAGRA